MRWMLIATGVALPAALLLEYLHGPPTIVFLGSAVAIIPLAGIVGRATEELGARVGPTLGGLMNAARRTGWRARSCSP